MQLRPDLRIQSSIDAMTSPIPPVKGAIGLAAKLGPRGLMEFTRMALLSVRRMAQEEFLERNGRRLGQPIRPSSSRGARRPRGGVGEPVGDRVRSGRVVRHRGEGQASSPATRQRPPHAARTGVSVPTRRAMSNGRVSLDRVRARRRIGDRACVGTASARVGDATTGVRGAPNGRRHRERGRIPDGAVGARGPDFARGRRL